MVRLFTVAFTALAIVVFTPDSSHAARRALVFAAVHWCGLAGRA